MPNRSDASSSAGEIDLNGRIASVAGEGFESIGRRTMNTAVINAPVATAIRAYFFQADDAGATATGATSGRASDCDVASVTGATNLKPLPAIVTMYLCSPARSPSVRRIAAIL